MKRVAKVELRLPVQEDGTSENELFKFRIREKKLPLAELACIRGELHAMRDKEDVKSNPYYTELIKAEQTTLATVKENLANEENNLLMSRRMETEAFHALRTSFDYIVKGKEKKVIMFTSSTSGEVKTFCALNLAGVLAMAGKKQYFRVSTFASPD